MTKANYTTQLESLYRQRNLVSNSLVDAYQQCRNDQEIERLTVNYESVKHQINELEQKIADLEP